VSDDPQFDDMISRAAKGYRAKSEPPADAMWSRIEGDVADAIRNPEPRIGRHLPWLAAGAGIAAALVIGVAIGRRSTQSDARTSPTTVATAGITPAQADSVREAQMRTLTLSHFAQAEMFLTEVRADLKTGRNDPQRDERSRELLSRTRLIMASDARRAPAVEQLLQDLELVLAGIAALPDSGARKPGDQRLIDEGTRVTGVLPRIRTLLPSPSAMAGS
jgi:hypothetical protein